jgi:peptide/nickel transport system substrate-binding protein
MGNPDCLPWPFIPEKAKDFLRDIGCIDSNGDGILEFMGQPLKFDMIIEAEGQGLTDLQGPALAIKDYLNELGIKIEIIHMDSQTILNRVFKNKQFDMVISSWAFDELNDVSSLFQTNGENNFVSYSNPEVDKYFKIISQAQNSELIRLSNFEIHNRIQVDCPYTFLWTLDKYAAINKKVRGTDNIHPFKFFSFIRQWYIPKEYQ